MAVKLTREAYGEKPKTEYKNNLDAINVQLIDNQTMEMLENYLPNFVRATYSEKWFARFTKLEELAIVRDVFMGRSLPTAQETIGLTFIIDGIDLTTVTHLIRHRTGSYSADCSAEKWWHEKDALVPSSIENSKFGKPGNDDHKRNDFYARFKNITEAAKQLYCDMIDSNDINIMDARAILPRCLSTYYFTHFPLNAAIAFIKQRVDRQIQPEPDNIIAYQMYLEILKAFPVANGMIDIDAQDKVYLILKEKQGPMFKPEPKNDVWQHTDDEFLYPKLRSEMSGTDGLPSKFAKHYKELVDRIKQQEETNAAWLKGRYNITFEELDKMEVLLR